MSHKVGQTKQRCPRQHARLKLKELFFNNHLAAGNKHLAVDNDTKGPFKSPEWKDGRTKSGDWPEQFPVCYVRDSKITLSATFDVIGKPDVDEEVEIIGSALLLPGQIAKWSCKVKVTTSAPTVSTGELEGAPALPDWVTSYTPFRIDWSSKVHDTVSNAGTSKNLLYVLLDKPLDLAHTTCYWTLLDISCRAAEAIKDESKFVPALYGAFSKAQSKNPKPLKRMRDDVPLRYWRPASAEVFYTPDLLSHPSGSGRCGAWSWFMVDMCKVHGVAAWQVAIEETTASPKTPKFDMLVKHWSFAATPDLPLPEVHRGVTFTHIVASFVDTYDKTMHYKTIPTGGCRCLPGIAAQGNDDPWSLFRNHAIVEHGGTYYDPSYGTPARPASGLEWETHALDGICYKGVIAGRHPGHQVFSFIPIK